MNFELKKVKYFDEMSEETPCFSAEIWEDGKHIADVKNDGHGGCNRVYPYSPTFSRDDMERYENMDVECQIFEMVDRIVFIKKFQTKSFVLAKDDKHYTTKFPMPISKLKKHSDFPLWRDNQIRKFKKDGYEVLNTNL